MKDAQGYPQGTKYFHKLGDNPYAADVVLPNGIVAYTQGETFEAFCKRNAGKQYSSPVTWEEYDKVIQVWEDHKTAQPAEIIDAATFNEMLNILPPCRWNTYAGINAFHISERIAGDLVHWYASHGGNYIRFVAPSTIEASFIHAKWDGVM